MKDNLIPKGIYCYDKYGTCPYFTYLDVDKVVKEYLKNI
jgi:hypothetical protein